MDRPSVGRIVHYVAYGGEFPAGVCRAAVITDVDDLTPNPRCSSTISVVVLNPTGLFFNHGIIQDDAKTPGSWHWPERV
jgi:hypothetical protein